MVMPGGMTYHQSKTRERSGYPSKTQVSRKSQVRGDLMTRVTQVYTKTVLFLYLEPRNLQ